jgi:NitT/TauT family transport system substrate-binding protein
MVNIHFVVGAYRKRSLAALVMLTIAVFAAAAGCGSVASSPSPAGTGPEQKDITVAVIRSVTAAGMYLAAQRGYFTSAGLHVTILPVTGSQAAIPDLVTNHVQVAFGSYVGDILAQAGGAASLRFLAAGNVSGPREQEVVVLPGSPITSPAGLPGSAVHFVDIPFPDVAAALAAHRIDAAYITDPFLTAARQKYGVKAGFDCDQGTVANLPIAGFATAKAWAAENPRTVSAFVGALEKGQALADSDRAAVNAALADRIGLPAKTAAAVSVGTFP